MNLNLGESIKLVLRTMPYLLMRIAVYSLIGIGCGIFLGVVWLFSKLFGGISGLILIIGIAALFGIIRLLREYVLYLIKAGHIAVLTEFIHKRDLPSGVNQVEYGKQAVTSLFKEVSILFAIDQMVGAILKAFNRMVVRVAEFLPIPGLESVAKLVNTILNFALTYIDESILSYSLARKDQNIWESARRGVVLYAQNWKPVLTTALGIAIFNFVGIVLFVGISLIPFGLIALAVTNETVKFFLFASGVTVGWSLKLAIINPITMVSMILTFNRVTEGQEPNIEWDSKLATYSTKFQDLKQKAIQGMRPNPPPQPTENQPLKI